MLRVPVEPVPYLTPGISGIVLPETLDFEKLGDKSSDQAKEKIQQHVNSCIESATLLCSSDILSSDCAEHVKTVQIPIELHGKHHVIDVRVDAVQVSGVMEPDNKGVRHMVKLPVNPRVLFDAVCRFGYTDTIDCYTFTVQKLQEIHIDESDDDSKKNISWCHVAYTADQLDLFLFSVRDFVTFDFAIEKHLLYCSRSCIHPAQPPLPVPTFCPSRESRAYRVPLFFMQRVIPDEENENSCTLCQFQFSDVGGIVPPRRQTMAIVEFGINNIPKLCKLCNEYEQYLGPETRGYMQDPLSPSWRQRAEDNL